MKSIDSDGEFTICDSCQAQITQMQIVVQDLNEEVWLVSNGLDICPACKPLASPIVWQLISSLRQEVNSLKRQIADID